MGLRSVFIDTTAYDAFIAIRKTGASAYTDKLNGFLYEFYIDQIAYSGGADRYITIGCDASPCYQTHCPSSILKCMWVLDYN